MDVESYESSYKRIKDSLMFSNDVARKAVKGSHISAALEDCNTCVSKGLKLASKLLQETNIQVNKLCDYIDNAVTLLHLLSDFIKHALESAAMTCCDMKPFPTTTGNIILTVFIHCKDSEWIYGNHIKSVETQLKELFRTCHELQLTYLMTLEKHFIFDLSEKEEQDVLIEALNINMRIGEITHALDVKTMAEQWKAYTVICEKYSNFLIDKNIYNKCSQLFSTIIIDNIKIAMESDQDNKSVVRSLKVANFTLKILTRISNVFKHATTNNYEHVVELMEYIYLHNAAYLERSSDKSQQFINLMLSNIWNPTDALCNVLLQDERFLDYVYKIDASKIELNIFLGYTILIVSIIKIVLQRKDDQVLNRDKKILIDCVFRILPLSHYWFNMGLRFPCKAEYKNDSYLGLYEYLLAHTVALATTLTGQEYAVLERRMYEAVMTTDCYSALFSSNLWVTLARISNGQLVSSTLSSLINVYQKLESHSSFHDSPQRVHLSYTIGKLFQVSSNENKILIGRQIEPQNALWSTFRVSNLPETLRRNMETGLIENLKNIYREIFESQDGVGRNIYDLIRIMNVAATCSFLETSNLIEQYVIKLWLKVCYKNAYINLDFGTYDTLLFYKYLEALVSLTDCIGSKLNSASAGKIIHSMSTLLNNCNTEITLLLFGLLCKLTFNRFEDENQHLIDNFFKDTLKVLLNIEDICIKQYVLNKLYKYVHNEQFQEITSELFYEDEWIRNEFNMNYKNKCQSIEWKEQLLETRYFGYAHKCARVTLGDCKNNSERATIGSSSNFDLGDFMFDDEVEEPSRKKAKLDLNDPDTLVERLENYTQLLCQVERTALDIHRKRLTNVIDKLRNIVS